jgi:hypothetical protein
MPAEGVTFSQLCCGRCWRRVMAACCSGIVVGSSEDHVRDVALDVLVLSFRVRAFR